MSEERMIVNIAGAGLAGLSAAISLARAGISCRLISSQQSERAQSVLAEGGINAALDTMGENDTTEQHFADTMKGGAYLEPESAVRGLTESAPDIVRELVRLGVPFDAGENGLILRSFGGQSKKRTAHAKSSTGKMIMTALIDEARRYEAAGLITRYPRHELVDIRCAESAGGDASACGRELESVSVRDSFSGELLVFTGPCILCTGGLSGIFEGLTTGTVQNSGNAAALAFDAGVMFANLEFIQYHPTTAAISNKRMLISEAARGEGGRLWIRKNGVKWYFMEEKYPELGNLMPRDVVSREMVLAAEDPDTGGSVFLDMTELPEEVWSGSLSDLREEVMSYLGTDPAKEPVAVEPGIHYFMGGIRVDDCHRTNIKGLYAAGEAACKYHGANRLGGNSMLGALYGGKVAAKTVISDEADKSLHRSALKSASGGDTKQAGLSAAKDLGTVQPEAKAALRDALAGCLGIIRRPEDMDAAKARLEELADGLEEGSIDRKRAMLGLAMTGSALARRESRGSHYRTDFPESSGEYRKPTLALYDRETGRADIWFEEARDDI